MNILILFFILERQISFFHHKNDISYGFLIDVLYQIVEVPFCFWVLNIFIMKECWILLNSFSASVEMIMWFLSLILLT